MLGSIFVLTREIILSILFWGVTSLCKSVDARDCKESKTEIQEKLCKYTAICSQTFRALMITFISQFSEILPLINSNRLFFDIFCQLLLPEMPTDTILAFSNQLARC